MTIKLTPFVMRDPGEAMVSYPRSPVLCERIIVYGSWEDRWLRAWAAIGFYAQIDLDRLNRTSTP